MAKTTNDHPLDKKLDRVIYLLESLLALELNQTNLNRNKIQARLGIDKAKVNKILNGIKKGVRMEDIIQMLGIDKKTRTKVIPACRVKKNKKKK